MIAFARAFPDHDDVAELAQQLSWSHIREVLALKSDDARTFYAEEAASKRLSVRELRTAIGRKAWERRAIANSQIPATINGPGLRSSRILRTGRGCSARRLLGVRRF